MADDPYAAFSTPVAAAEDDPYAGIASVQPAAEAAKPSSYMEDVQKLVNNPGQVAWNDIKSIPGTIVEGAKALGGRVYGDVSGALNGKPGQLAQDVDSLTRFVNPATGVRDIAQRVMADPEGAARLIADPAHPVQSLLNFIPAIGAERALPAALRGMDTAVNMARGTPAPEALGRARLGQIFDVPLSKGQVSGTVKQLGAEDQLAHGGRGAGAQQIMQDAREQQAAALTDAGQKLRTQLSGAPQPLTPTQIGEQGFQGLQRKPRGAAGQNHVGLLRHGFDPRVGVAAAGHSTSLFRWRQSTGLPNALEHAFVRPFQPVQAAR